MRLAMLSLTSVFLLAAGAGHAADFEKLDDGGVRHASSGWVFPQKVGEYQRTGEPEVLATDVVAQYERQVNGNLTTATVYVYPSDTRAFDSSFELAKMMIVAKLKSEFLAQSWSEGPFRVGTALALVGEKAFYKVGLGPTSWQSNLYFFDTGKWIVKIRMTTQKTDQDTFPTLDAFVRGQPWDSLGLTAETCSGSACKVDRPIPTHGALPERLGMLLVSTKLKDVFPREMPACEPAALESALATAPLLQASGEPEPVQIVASCAPRKGMRASFVRLTFSKDIRDKLEASPDGLSLRDPVTFVVMSNGKSSMFTQMHDGRLDAATVARVLQALNAKRLLIFGKGDKNGKKPELVMRDLLGLAEVGG